MNEKVMNRSDSSVRATSGWLAQRSPATSGRSALRSPAAAGRRISRLVAVCAVLTAVLFGVTSVQAQQHEHIRPHRGHVAEMATYLGKVQIHEPVVSHRLAVYPITLRDGATLGGSWLTMNQAISRGLLVITEKGGGGRVPVVSVENLSRHEHVFIMSGEVMTGGKQTRTVRQDTVLAPGQRIDLQVFCVEQHRWKGKKHFAASRAVLPQSIRKSLRSGADQAQVWAQIAENNQKLGAKNATGSLEKALDSEPVRRKLAEVRARIVPQMPGETVGFIFVHRGRAVGADFIGRSDLALALLPKLLDSYSVDLIVRKHGRIIHQAHPGGNNAAIEFFKRIQRAGSGRSGTPGSGSGINTRAGGILGDGVSLGGELVHYGAQPQHRIIPMPRPIPLPRPIPFERPRRPLIEPQQPSHQH